MLEGGVTLDSPAGAVNNGNMSSIHEFPLNTSKLQIWLLGALLLTTLSLGGAILATFQSSVADLRTDLRAVQSEVRSAAIASSQVTIMREKQIELDARIRALEIDGARNSAN